MKPKKLNWKFTVNPNLPYLLSFSDEELANYVQARAKEVAEATQPPGLGSLGELAGGATHNAYAAFDRASLRALTEGKTPQEAVLIGKAALGVKLSEFGIVE